MAAEETQHAKEMQQLQHELDEAMKDHERRDHDRRANGLPVYVMAVPMTAEQEAAPPAAGAPAELPVMAVPMPAESADELDELDECIRIVGSAHAAALLRQLQRCEKILVCRIVLTNLMQRAAEHVMKGPAQSECRRWRGLKPVLRT